MSYARILKSLKQHQTFLVASHVNPDPDALCSQLAMKFLLEALGKKVWTVSAEKLPSRFGFLPGSRLIRPADRFRPKRPDVLVVVDCGDFDRIGAVKNCVLNGHQVINVDHHTTNTFFGDLNLVEPEASSTCEVIYPLFKKAGVPLTPSLAMLLYTGIMTDTGCFRYENTTAQTHEVVSRLLRHQVPVSRLYTRIYETIPLSDVQNFGRLVNAFDILARGRIIVLELHKKIVESFSEDFDLRDKIFRYLRAVKGVEVIVILTEHEKKKTRVNLRSSGSVNVALIARMFGGGGHKRASGCQVAGDIKTARDKVLKEIKQHV